MADRERYIYIYKKTRGNIYTYRAPVADAFGLIPNICREGSICAVIIRDYTRDVYSLEREGSCDRFDACYTFFSLLSRAGREA